MLMLLMESRVASVAEEQTTIYGSVWEVGGNRTGRGSVGTHHVGAERGNKGHGTQGYR